MSGLEGQVQQESRLLQLPPEIRNRIYEAVLLKYEMVDILRGTRVPPVLRTCHQIRYEASGIYYARTILVISAAPAFSKTNFIGYICKWLKALRPMDRSAIRTIYLDDDYYHVEEASEDLRSYEQHFAQHEASVSADVLYVELQEYSTWVNRSQARAQAVKDGFE